MFSETAGASKVAMRIVSTSTGYLYRTLVVFFLESSAFALWLKHGSDLITSLPYKREHEKIALTKEKRVRHYLRNGRRVRVDRRRLKTNVDPVFEQHSRKSINIGSV